MPFRSQPLMTMPLVRMDMLPECAVKEVVRGPVFAGPGKPQADGVAQAPRALGEADEAGVGGGGEGAEGLSGRAAPGAAAGRGPGGAPPAERAAGEAGGGRGVCGA